MGLGLGLGLGLELAPIHEGVEERVGYRAAAQAVHGAGGDGRDDLLVRVRLRVRLRVRVRVEGEGGSLTRSSCEKELSQRLLASLSAFASSNLLRVNARVYLSPGPSPSAIGG